jgi:perosamine synthetase
LLGWTGGPYSIDENQGKMMADESHQNAPRFYPISQPAIGNRELEYVVDAVKSGWISSLGRYIEEFEQAFAKFCGTRYALAVSNGTTGLHLALVSLGIRPGDEVIVPDLTFVATANAVAYTGAKVVPVDVEAESLCVDVAAARRAITPRTRAIIPVHLYGHPARMDAIAALAKDHGIQVVEDAAEAHGAEYGGRKVGSLGDCGVFSFYGNKIITTGEGGMITTDRADLYAKAKLLRDHAMSPERRYWHTEIGYNYRMTNLQAALGLAQLERMPEFLQRRQEIVAWYRSELRDGRRLQLNRDGDRAQNVYWMVCLEIEGMSSSQREQLMRELRNDGVDSRPYFYPISDLPMYCEGRVATPVAHLVSSRGINLPSYSDLQRDDVRTICAIARRALHDLDLWS